MVNKWILQLQIQGPFAFDSLAQFRKFTVDENQLNYNRWSSDVNWLSSSSSDPPLSSFSFSSASCRSIILPQPLPYSTPTPFATNPTINLSHNPQHKSPIQFSSPSICSASFLWEQWSSHHNFLSSFSFFFPSSFHILLSCFSFLSSCLLAPHGIT